MKKHNKYRSIIFFLVFSFCLLESVNGQWLQVNQAGSANSVNSNDIAVDSIGNVYIVGTFSGESYFGNDTIVAHTDGDYFIAKYNSAGALLWIKTAGGYSSIDGLYTTINSIVIGEANTFYITGKFPGGMLIDTFLVTAFSQEADIFIAKFDSAGNCLWVKNAGGLGSDVGTDVERDQNNNIYVTGSINTVSNVYFESDTIPISNSVNRLFLAKYSSNGNLLWVHASTGSGSSGGSDLSCYQSYVYVGGRYDSTSVFDTIQFTSSGSSDIIILQYDSLGHIQWGRTANEPTSGDRCTSLSNDSSGNCYAIGLYADTISFDTMKLGSTGVNDCFIAKYSMTGNFLWAKQLSASQEAIGTDIKTNPLGNSYITGYFKGSAKFGNFILNSSSGQDMFLARYDSSGDCIGVCQVTHTVGYAIRTDLNGNCFVTGYLSDTAIFDSFTLYQAPYNSSIYWAELNKITGIEDNERSATNELIIYANPSQGKCNITVPQEFLHEKHLTLTIFDSGGRVIQNGSLKMDENKILINLEEEAKGIYNVILSNGKKSYGGKIVYE